MEALEVLEVLAVMAELADRHQVVLEEQMVLMVLMVKTEPTAAQELETCTEQFSYKVEN